MSSYTSRRLLTRSFAALHEPKAPYTPPRGLTRAIGAFTRAEGSLHAATGCLTRDACRFTRAIGALHATNVALHEPKAPYTPPAAALLRRVVRDNLAVEAIGTGTGDEALQGAIYVDDGDVTRVGVLELPHDICHRIAWGDGRGDGRHDVAHGEATV